MCLYTKQLVLSIFVPIKFATQNVKLIPNYRHLHTSTRNIGHGLPAHPAF